MGQQHRSQGLKQPEGGFSNCVALNKAFTQIFNIELTSYPYMHHMCMHY